MDGRNGRPRNRRLMSNRLEQELSGFEERGMRSNRTRIPAKSYLPKVLLSSNPLVERDLQKTLTQIHLGRTRKQKTWEWNQRHFFVSQIFDPEYNLRFTQGLTKYSTDATHSASGRFSSRRPSHFRKVVKADIEDEVDGITDENIVGLGVFMPPLHPSQRIIEKQKIPNGTSIGPKPAQKPGLPGAMSSPDLSYNKDQPANGTRLYREKRISNTAITTRDDPSSKEAESVPARVRRVTLASAKCSSDRRLHKATSLPEIPLYRPVTHDPLLQKSVAVENPESNLPVENFSRQNSKPEILCHDQVIVKLTRSLPLSVMIKANQNINKVVQRRKAVMIERCKTARDKNSFEDPRWKELENVLEAPNQT